MAIGGQNGRADFDAGVLTTRRRSLLYYLVGHLFAALVFGVLGWVTLAL